MKHLPILYQIVILSALTPEIAVAQAATKLVSGQPIEAELTQNATHTYSLDLEANTGVVGQVDQISVDVVVTVFDPSEQEVRTFDGPGRGPERFRFIADEAGTYRIEVSPFGGGTGSYAVLIERAASVAGHPTRPTIALTDVTVVDVVSGRSETDMTVLIRGDRITSVGPSAEIGLPDSVVQIDAGGKFLIPGLWDMHSHVFTNTSIAGSTKEWWYFPLFIANGVTGVREMWTDLEDVQLLRKWRKEIAAGLLAGPRMVAASTILDGPRVSYRNMLPVQSAGEAVRVVDSLVEGGAGFIKVYQQLPRDAYFAIAERAQELGVPFSGHVPFSVTAWEASDAGQKSIEHLNGIRESCFTGLSSVQVRLTREHARLYLKQALDSYSEERCIALFERFNINKTWQVPTLVLEHRWVMAHDSAFTNDPRLEYIPGGRPRSWRRMTARSDERVALLLRSFREDLRMVGEMHRRGVPMLVGTDVANEFIYPGFSVHDELELLVEAGLSPLAALQAATLNPAIYLGARDSLGSVETGKMADLVLLDANPLEDIGNTKRIHAVVVGGRLFERTSLDSMLVRARNRR